MDGHAWGIAGIGKLGTAIMKQLDLRGTYIGFYHPNQKKMDAFAQTFPQHFPLTKTEIAELDFLLLALPANQIAPFVTELASSQISLKKPVFVNLATVMNTADLRKQFPDLKWVGIKYMGHSEDLLQRGNGLFIMEQNTSPSPEEQSVHQFFSQLGQVCIDSESTLEEVNKLATYHAIKAAKELEEALRKAGYPKEYVTRALLSISPEVIRSYANDTLGHFGRMIAAQLNRRETE